MKMTKAWPCMAIIMIVFISLISVLLSNESNAIIDENEEYQYSERTDGTISITRYVGTSISVTIPESLNGMEVKSLASDAFKNTNIRDVTLYSGIEYIGAETFANCYNLTSISLNDGLIEIGAGAFMNCDKLTSIKLPDSLSSIAGDAFYNCSSLMSVNIPSGITWIGDGAFAGCISLSTFEGPSNGHYWCDGPMLFEYNCLVAYPSAKGSVTIPSTVTDVYDSVFERCTELVSITIPNTISSIGINMFSECTSLENVSLAYGITTIEFNAFENCSSLKNIELPDSITHIDANAFSGCSSIETITLPSSLDAIPNRAFSGCSSLKTISIPTGIESIGIEAFKGCSSLSSLEIPSSVISIEEYAFQNCSSLEELSIPSSVTDLSGNAFSSSGIVMLSLYCQSSDDLYFSSTLRYLVLYADGNYRINGSDIIVYTDMANPESRVTAILDTTLTFRPIADIGKIDVNGVSLDRTSANMIVGDTIELRVTVSPSDATDSSVIWTTSDPSVATVTQNGVIHAIASGTAIITVITNDGNFEASCIVSTSIPVTGVTLNQSNITLSLWDTFNLVATVTPTNADDTSLNWYSSDSSIAGVGQNGIVQGLALGETTITVETNDGGYTASCTVSVVETTYPVTGINLNRNSLEMTEGEQTTLFARIEPSYATDWNVSWSSSNSSIVIVNDGLVKAISEGTAIVTATTRDGGFTASCTVYVTPNEIPAEEVEINPQTLTLNVGDSWTLDYTVYPINSTEWQIDWSSSDPSVAIIDSDGTIYAISKGEAIISASVNGYVDSCVVTVIVPVTDVTLNLNRLIMEPGDTAVLTATIIPENASNLKTNWTSSDRSVVTVDTQGIVTAISDGYATITVTTDDGNYIATCRVTVGANIPVTGITMNSGSETMNVGDWFELTYTIHPTNADNTEVEWQSTDTSVVIVDSSGIVRAIGEGTAIITATTVDGGYSAVCSIVVENPTSDGSRLGIGAYMLFAIAIVVVVYIIAFYNRK